MPAVPMTPMRPLRVVGHGRAHGGVDHLDHRHVVALARVAQHRGGRGVARDHEHLHALRRRASSSTSSAVAADIGDRLRPVRGARGVADVEDRLPRQQGR